MAAARHSALPQPVNKDLKEETYHGNKFGTG